MKMYHQSQTVWYYSVVCVDTRVWDHSTFLDL